MLRGTNEERIIVLERELQKAQQRIEQLESSQRGRWVNELKIKPFKAQAKSGESYPAYGSTVLPGMLADPSHNGTSTVTAGRAANGMMDIGLFDDFELMKEGESAVAFKYGNQWFKVPGGLRGLIAYTPVGGIPAASGATLGRAECDIWAINTSTHTRIDLSVSWDVYNMIEEAVAGSTFVQIKPAYFDAWMVDVEPCPES